MSILSRKIYTVGRDGTVINTASDLRYKTSWMADKKLEASRDCAGDTAVDIRGIGCAIESVIHHTRGEKWSRFGIATLITYALVTVPLIPFIIGKLTQPRAAQVKVIGHGDNAARAAKLD